jgi:hypothetical protein
MKKYVRAREVLPQVPPEYFLTGFRNWSGILKKSQVTMACM